MEAPLPLRIAIETDRESVSSSMTIADIDGDHYRIEFWPDDRWAMIPEGSRPMATRAHTQDGWFAFTAISRCSRPS